MGESDERGWWRQGWVDGARAELGAVCVIDVECGEHVDRMAYARGWRLAQDARWESGEFPPAPDYRPFGHPQFVGGFSFSRLAATPADQAVAMARYISARFDLPPLESRPHYPLFAFGGEPQRARVVVEWSKPWWARGIAWGIAGVYAIQGLRRSCR